MARTHCLTCGQPLSRYSTTCPRCGAPQPHKRMGSTLGILVLIVGVLAWLAWGFLSGDAPQP